MNGTTDDTEYEDDDYDAETFNDADTPEPEPEASNAMIEDSHARRFFPQTLSHLRASHPSSSQTSQPTREPDVFTSRLPTPSIETNTASSSAQNVANRGSTTPANRFPRATGPSGSFRTLADVLPIVESSRSPPPSDGASNQSGGTTRSNGNGTTFFRTYQGPTSRPNSGALTPDLNYAEIGHGRGAVSAFGLRRGQEHLPHARTAHTGPVDASMADIVASSHPAYIAPSSPAADTVVWPYREPTSPVPPSPSTVQGGDNQGRGRSVKRSLRNTFSAAEQYASTFLFGRHHDNGDGPSGSGDANGMVH